MKIFRKIGMCVWLVDNKIVGWKVDCKWIGGPLFYNTSNWHPFSMYHNFKKLNIYVPWFLYNHVFGKTSRLWFRRWKHHERFKGWKAY